MLKRAIVIGIVMVAFTSGTPSAQAKDLIASVGIIPPHAVKGTDGQPSGGFVEIVKAIDGFYKEGRIDIQLYPIARAMSVLKSGQADFFIPYIPPPHLSDHDLSYAFASESIVPVAFVLYTHADAPVPSMDQLGNYSIETLRGAADHFPFKIGEIDSFRQGLMKVVAGRSDGFIVEQDAADKYIRENKMKHLRRTLYAVWDSSIVIPKGEKGREINRILSAALRALKQSGELQKITQTIHKPYGDWQPYDMDW